MAPGSFYAHQVTVWLLAVAGNQQKKKKKSDESLNSPPPLTSIQTFPCPTNLLLLGLLPLLPVNVYMYVQIFRRRRPDTVGLVQHVTWFVFHPAQRRRKRPDLEESYHLVYSPPPGVYVCFKRQPPACFFSRKKVAIPTHPPSQRERKKGPVKRERDGPH